MQNLCPSIPNIKLCSHLHHKVLLHVNFVQCCALCFIGNDATGDLKKRLGNHRAVIFFIGWNSKGDFLLTGSRGNRIVVWDTNTWESIQEVAFHSGES